MNTVIIYKLHREILYVLLKDLRSSKVCTISLYNIGMYGFL